VIAYRLQRWLEWSHSWEPRFQRIHLPFDKGSCCGWPFWEIADGMVRGPWIGGILGALGAIIGNSVNPRRASIRVGLIVLAIGIPTGAAFYSYISVGRAHATTVAQESAAYR